jgi:hypothetical protein
MFEAMMSGATKPAMKTVKSTGKGTGGPVQVAVKSGWMTATPCDWNRASCAPSSDA